MQLFKYIFLTDNRSENLELYEKFKYNSDFYYMGKKLSFVGDDTNIEPDLLEISICAENDKIVINIIVWEFDKSTTEYKKSLGKYTGMEYEHIFDTIKSFITILHKDLYRDDDKRTLNKLISIWNDCRKNLVFDGKVRKKESKIVEINENNTNRKFKENKTIEENDSINETTIQWNDTSQILSSSKLANTIRRLIITTFEVLTKPNNTYSNNFKGFMKSSSLIKESKKIQQYDKKDELINLIELSKQKDEYKINPERLLNQLVNLLNKLNIKIDDKDFIILVEEIYEFFNEYSYSTNGPTNDVFQSLRKFLADKNINLNKYR